MIDGYKETARTDMGKVNGRLIQAVMYTNGSEEYAQLQYELLDEPVAPPCIGMYQQIEDEIIDQWLELRVIFTQQVKTGFLVSFECLAADIIKKFLDRADQMYATICECMAGTSKVKLTVKDHRSHIWEGDGVCPDNYMVYAHVYPSGSPAVLSSIEMNSEGTLEEQKAKALAMARDLFPYEPITKIGEWSEFLPESEIYSIRWKDQGVEGISTRQPH